MFNFSELTDQELLALLSTDKKQKAFRTLFDRYHPFVLKKCKRFIKDYSEAEDMAQHIFLKLDTRYQSFEGKSSFKTWLYSITYRDCLVYLREAKKFTLKSVDIEELKEAYDYIDLDIDVDMETNRNLDLLNQIDPLDKALLLMKYKDGMKLRIISESLQLGESNVKMRLKRAKARLLKLRAAQEKK
jgi:RNA polymerase sigma-70 factor (ECF subfamily)